MKRISSRQTVFYKRVFPVLWFGFIAFTVLVDVLETRRAPHAVPFPVVVVPVVMAVLGYALFRRLLFDLVDEVWDAYDALVVRKAGVEARVPLKDIINVGYSSFTSPARVTLMLRDPSPLGRHITFIPWSRAFTFRWLSRNPIIDELIERVDQARRRADFLKATASSRQLSPT